MKKLILISTALILFFSSCIKTRIADVVIRYEVEATNPHRPFSVYYANTWYGEDVQRNVRTRLFFKEFLIPSNEPPQEYFLSVECLEDIDFNSQQRIITRIYEDGVLLEERLTGGSYDIPESRTYISAILPTGIRYEEY